MARLRMVLVTLTAVLLINAAGAFEVDKPLPDPAQEARAQSLFGLLRCLVCQNQSLSESNAGLARDLRLIVRERIAAGDSDDEAIDYLVDRYGDWVLLEPPLRAGTILLWVGPFALLVLAGGGVFLAVRRRRPSPDARGATLDETEAARLREILADQAGER